MNVEYNDTMYHNMRSLYSINAKAEIFVRWICASTKEEENFYYHLGTRRQEGRECDRYRCHIQNMKRKLKKLQKQNEEPIELKIVDEEFNFD